MHLTLSLCFSNSETMNCVTSVTICNLVHLHKVDNLPPATPERDVGNRR